ncbi:MAG: tyrosine-type recombinase/integrase [Terracidiphilus sp.]
MLKKKVFDDTEVPIFEEAIVYQRGEYWQFRMYLAAEKKYIVKSLHTRNRALAIDKGKTMFHEIFASVQAGKKLFSFTCKEAVANYLKYRETDLRNGAIVPGRMITITSHLNHFLEFIGRETKIKELENDAMDEYFSFRKAQDASQSTIVNEQSTVNAVIKWLYRNGQAKFDAFTYRPLPKVDTQSDAIRRATFTEDEYKAIYTVARDYVNQKRHKLEEAEHRVRQVVRHWILINANCGMRNSESRLLKWSDVEIIHKKTTKHNGDDLDNVLVVLNIRAETSKVRKSRRAICRGGQYFERLHDFLRPEDSDSLVFSIDGETELSEKLLLKHFYAILQLANVSRVNERGIVPYSLRHYMITNRINAGLSYEQVSKIVGTSIKEIERTYYHLSDKERIAAALIYNQQPTDVITRFR